MLKRSCPTFHESSSLSKTTEWNYFLKRLGDYFGAGILLIVFCPFLIVIAVSIKLDSPGPIFFKQIRIGLGGEKFTIWKFRTMQPNAERIQIELEAVNEIKGGMLFKIQRDPRITRLGRHLRRHSLDEIPQLFNVLQGQMSLIGPRPLPLRDIARIPAHYHLRHDLLPGITGLGQIKGRSNCSSQEYLDWDLHYVKNWSLGLDLKILFVTIPSILKKTGAF